MEEVAESRNIDLTAYHSTHSRQMVQAEQVRTSYSSGSLPLLVFEFDLYCPSRQFKLLFSRRPLPRSRSPGLPWPVHRLCTNCSRCADNNSSLALQAVRHQQFRESRFSSPTLARHTSLIRDYTKDEHAATTAQEQICYFHSCKER